MLTTLPLPDSLSLTPQGSALIAEIEAYLATLPVQARAVVPFICNYGSTVQRWNAGLPQPQASLLDRLAHRPARPIEVSVADHLRLTSRYLTEVGWVQGRLWDSAGRVCLLGAQTAVLLNGYGTPYTVSRARNQVMEVLHATGRPVASPDVFNDAPTTRQSDVHLLLDRASARAFSLGI
ncbi:hypothetical protein TR51_27335 [Kitasatospora griseola]|uniref:Uncharacterized protein n=1 Tax=Kitasatospora griseola TaxID=2064 RepID=A0A0D0PJN1_KITGR|nr:hypothetical protein [Kitasatospora griseola]KIQ62684.1 hypothetical protein TR51_27335 [Kitasatospora griseola]